MCCLKFSQDCISVQLSSNYSFIIMNKDKWSNFEDLCYSYKVTLIIFWALITLTWLQYTNFPYLNIFCFSIGKQGQRWKHSSKSDNCGNSTWFNTFRDNQADDYHLLHQATERKQKKGGEKTWYVEFGNIKFELSENLYSRTEFKFELKEIDDDWEVSSIKIR